MKIFFLTLVCFTIVSTLSYSQEQPPQQQQVQSRQPTHQNHLNSGFYIKLGGSFPMGEFANQQLYNDQGKTDTIAFNRGKFGGVFELGYIIYLGPAFAKNHLRAGLDATFLAMSFNPSDQNLASGSSSTKKLQYWYYFAGQKFGPIFTINPVDYLMIDLSYKINATAAWFNNMWGMNLALNEVSFGIRYRVIMFGFQYNWGKVNYTYNNDNSLKCLVDNSTYRVLIGFKF